MVDERRVSGEFPEQLAESALIAESAMFHDFLNGDSGGFQHLPCGVQPAACDECDGGESGFLPEQMKKTGFAQTGRAGKIFHPDLSCEFPFDPGDRAENTEVAGTRRRSGLESGAFLFPQNGGEFRKKFQNGHLFFPVPERERPEILFQKCTGGGGIPFPEDPRQQKFPASAVVKKRDDQFRHSRVTGADERFFLCFRPLRKQEVIVFRAEMQQLRSRFDFPAECALMVGMAFRQSAGGFAGSDGFPLDIQSAHHFKLFQKPFHEKYRLLYCFCYK